MQVPLWERVVLASDADLLELLKYVMTRHMPSCMYVRLQMIGGKLGSQVDEPCEDCMMSCICHIDSNLETNLAMIWITLLVM